MCWALGLAGQEGTSLRPKGDRAGSQGETRWLRLGTHRLWGHCMHQDLGMSEWERRRAGGAGGDGGEGETVSWRQAGAERYRRETAESGRVGKEAGESWVVEEGLCMSQNPEGQ